MEWIRNGAAIAAIALPVAATALPAQSYRLDAGVHGGFAWWSSALDEDHLGEDAEDVKFDAGFLTGAQVTYWVPGVFGLRDRLGLRANFGFSERPLEQDGEDLVPDVNLWSGSGDLLFRFMGPDPRGAGGMEMLPYIALGVGQKWINPAEDTQFVDNTDDGEGDSGAAFQADGRNFFLKEEGRLMGLVALGTDVRVARSLGLRLEVGDRFFDAPIFALNENGQLDEEDEDVGNVVHEVFGQLGLHLLLGVREPERVAVLPAPAPAPPAPAEEAVTVCVIDPTAEGGIREVRAIFVPSTGDTLVAVNGRRVPLDQATGEVALATNADWFVQGQPLAVEVGDERAEFVTFGGSRIVAGEDLAFLGTVNGVAVYADRDEVQDIQEELDELREAQGDDDLEEILEENDDLREDFEDIEVLYVPLQPTGCVFQPVRRAEEVRKIRG